jgi:hypothetical protein
MQTTLENAAEMERSAVRHQGLESLPLKALEAPSITVSELFMGSNEDRFNFDHSFGRKLSTEPSSERGARGRAVKSEIAEHLTWEIVKSYTSLEEMRVGNPEFARFLEIVRAYEGEGREQFARWAITELMSNAYDNWMIQAYVGRVMQPQVIARASRTREGFCFDVTDLTGPVVPGMRPFLFEHHFEGRELLGELVPETFVLANSQEQWWPLRREIPEDMAKRSIKMRTGLPLCGGCGAGLATLRQTATQSRCGYFYRDLKGMGSQFGISIPYS